jgi:cyclic pyranopterin phosphate synthase
MKTLPLSEVKSIVPVLDTLARPLRSLRISVTDRCNLRCQYCMPEEEYIWLNRSEILTFEETAELATVFGGLGVDKVRLTGGEPLLRQDLDQLVRMLSAIPQIRDLALTTNGILLAQQAGALRQAGLERLTVSLDTLRPERFRLLSRRHALDQVREGLHQASAAGFKSLKINSVVIKGFNDDELADLMEFSRETGAEVRFIEYMDVGGATRWSAHQVFTRAAMLESLGRRYGTIRPLEEAEFGPETARGKRNAGSLEAPAEQESSWQDRRSTTGRSKAPADRYALPDGLIFGIISSTTQPFCRTCDRARLTPDGLFLLCLYAKDGVDLKKLLRSGASADELARTITTVWHTRTDRGAEERLHLSSRGALFQVEDLRRDPHREMHTRGG